MYIRKIDPAKFETAYGVSCQRVFPSEESGDTPFNAFWSLVEPGGASQLHRHHEGEAFIIVKGRGVMTVGDESAAVEVGDVIFMKPLSDHTLANVSDSEPLLFLNVYWEDIELLLSEDGDEAGTAAPAGVRTIAYPSPPNPNGDLHLGHLAGPVLSADIFVRHRRMLGDPAYFVIGTDDNQVWTAAMAAKRGTTPQATADHFADKIAATMEKAGIDCAHYYRPNASPYHTELVHDIVRKLHAAGHLVAKDAPALVCDSCDLYLFEVRVSGRCPHCGKPTCGNACEECGRPNEVVDLIDPVCSRCGETPAVKPVRRLFFPLEPHREMLVDYHRKTAMTTQHRALCHQLLEGELPDIVASHICDWGIPVGIEGFAGHCLSAWVEMAPGYLAASAELSDKIGQDGGWRTFWGSEDARVVQFFGFDNCWNHGVLYPALLKAWDADARPPEAFVSNQLYRLDHEKFSTSRNHAVWTRDLVELNSPDTVRFYAAYTAPEVEQTNFSLAEFADFTRRELIGRWQPWLRAVQAKMDEVYGGKVPEAGAWTDNHLSFLKRLAAFLDQTRAAYAADSFSPQRATRVACELVRSARDFGIAEDAWSRAASAHNERRTGIALELAAVRTLAMMIAPMMPDFSGRTWKALGYATPLEKWQRQPQFVEPGNVVAGLDAAHFPEPVIEKPAAVGAV